MESSGEGGQALPLALGGALALLALALALVAIAGAVTGKGRVQRAADLIAVSAARSMRDDLPRLLTPERLPDGSANPRHLDKEHYLGRARAAALEAARRNGVDAGRVQLSFPDAGSFAPLRVRVLVTASLNLLGSDKRVAASAVAEAAAASGVGAQPAVATGGGYMGPLAYRQGEGMRPDVAAAFDRMATAASGAGLALLVNSGFRSDAEQAALFAAHPDPRWVAAPATPCTAARPSSTSVRPRHTAGWRPMRGASASSSATAGCCVPFL